MTDDPIGDDVPTFGTDEMSTFEAAVRRHIQGNWSLASDVWSLVDDDPAHGLRVTFHHRDSISRIQLSTTGSWVDTDVRVEVYRPLSKEQVRQEPDADINDLTVTDKTFDLIGEAVWFAEYFARTVDDRIPDDPAEHLHNATGEPEPEPDP